MRRLAERVGAVLVGLLLAGCPATDPPDPPTGPQAPAAAASGATGPAGADGDRLWLDQGRLRRSDGASWDQPLELDHIGQARIGAPFVDDDWLDEWVPVAGDATAAGPCNRLRSDALPPGVSMLVLGGAIARFDLSAEDTPAAMSYQAPFGLRLGQA
ncbi:MAG TPA: hypothetical protein VLK29_13150, partial [Luteimonas sp.]|nr:hypothetical protein [Luteimonas sp.]